MSDPAEVPVTRITADYDVGFGRFLALRGDQAPLDWNTGWPGFNTDNATWRWVLTELEGPFACKTLLDDATWQTGDNVGATAGTDVRVVPSF